MEAEGRFDPIRRKSAFWLGIGVFVFLLLLPMPGITGGAHRLAAVLGLVIIFWIGEAIPIPVTALLGTTLCVVLGVAPVKEVFAPFADPIVFLFIGSFILARGLEATGLDRRLALMILSLRVVGDSPVRILFTLGAVTALMSMWISNTATTATMYPIALGILSAVHRDQKAGVPARLGTATMLLIAYSASIGGIGTPVGSPPNLIGIGMISRYLNVTISFFQWMLVTIPILVVTYFGLLFLLRVLESPVATGMTGLGVWVREQRRLIPGWSRGEVNCLIAFMTAVVLWVFPGILALVAGTDSPAYRAYSRLLPEGVVAILAASLLFVLPTNWKRGEFTLTWREAAQIDWGTILLFGGGLSLGSLLFKTGLAETLGKGFLGWLGISSLWGITAVSIALAIVLSETTSNTASATMAIPIVISLAESAGVSGLLPALGACLGASFGFMLPVSTPPNAIVYGSGLVPITRMVRAGILFDLIGFLVIWLALRLLSPLFGWT